MKSEEIAFEDGFQAVTLINTGKTEAEILTLTKKIAAQNPQMMQWRMDCFEDVTKMNRLLELAPKIKAELQDIPLLVTFRSQNLGGMTELDSEDAYLNLIKIAIDFKLGDAIDIEMSHTQDRVQALLNDAHQQGLKVTINQL